MKLRDVSPRPLRRRLALAAALGALALSTPAAAEMRLTSEGTATTFHITSWRDLPFRTVIRQQYDYSCGSAALATLLSFHYGVPLGEADVFRAMYEAGDREKIRKVGFSLLDMKRYLESLGLKADGFKLSLDALAKTATPAIALIDQAGYKHFVVIKGVRSGTVLVGDPTLGLKSYGAEEFAAMWNGIVFAIPKATQKPEFNRDDEWRMRRPAALDVAEVSRPVDQLTREIAPLYQITPAFSLDWALP